MCLRAAREMCERVEPAATVVGRDLGDVVVGWQPVAELVEQPYIRLARSLGAAATGEVTEEKVDRPIDAEHGANDDDRCLRLQAHYPLALAIRLLPWAAAFLQVR